MKKFVSILISLFVLAPNMVMAAELEKAPILAQIQVEKLAERFIEVFSSKEDGHANKWVEVIIGGKDVPQGLRDEVVKIFPKELVIYTDEKDIPEEYVERNKNDHADVLGYHKGCAFLPKILFQEDGSVRITYFIWHGNQGSIQFDTVYKWDDNDWVKVPRADGLVEKTQS